MKSASITPGWDYNNPLLNMDKKQSAWLRSIVKLGLGTWFYYPRGTSFSIQNLCDALKDLGYLEKTHTAKMEKYQGFLYRIAEWRFEEVRSAVGE